jgi:hypothetical protein
MVLLRLDPLARYFFRHGRAVLGAGGTRY